MQRFTKQENYDAKKKNLKKVKIFLFGVAFCAVSWNKIPVLHGNLDIYSYGLESLRKLCVIFHISFSCFQHN